ncbi:MAG TPA: histone deacetylase [Myxococcota bacterium]|nr:histone deacetylase [Myxococcota bacterium]
MPEAPAAAPSARPIVVEDPRYQHHRAPAGHPERPERLVAVARAIARREGELARRAPRPAADAELLRVHPSAHLATLAAAVARAPAQLDPDTYVSSESLEVARLAAGASIDLAGAVARGDAPSGLAAVRPPGHHAEADRAMGFCLLNNVAIAARALQREHDAERVLIVDWDVHHGNGTQHVFEAERDVLYFSTHQYPFYPGTGAFHEAGRGEGLGATVNVPMPPGCGDDVYAGVARRILAPVVRGFRPDVILVSCGFDAHASDPLASMELSGAGFLALARIVRALADDACGGRLALVLEGGYAAVGLDEGTSAVLEALLEAPPRTLPTGAEPEPGSTLHALVEGCRAAHGDRFPGLGAL